MSQRAKNNLLELVVGAVLPQQVPDAEVLSDRAAFERFGLGQDGLEVLPDFLAYSRHHNALFFIHIGAISHDRVLDLARWSNGVTCYTIHVSVFVSREVYSAHMDEQAANTFVWFADEPKHYVLISGSPEASAEFLSARFSAKSRASTGT